MVAQYHGQEGCSLYEAPADDAYALLEPAIGGLLIAIGLFLAFAGSKFLFVVFAILAFFVVATLAFMYSYNFLPKEQVTVWSLVAVLVASLVLGGVTARYSHRFFRAWGIPLVSAWGAVIIGLVLAQACGITNGTASLVIAFACGMLGAWLGRSASRFLRSAGTAFFGSFMVIRGIACYAGHYPGDSGPGDVESPAALWGYLGGLILLTFAGAWTQLYCAREEVSTKDDDDYLREDAGSSGCCGCC